MTTLAFVDTETTGLDPDRHEVWEVALILRDSDGKGVSQEWQLPVDVGRADAAAVSIGCMYERYAGLRDDVVRSEHITHRGDFAREFAALTHGAHLVGAVPSFDDAFLKRLLRANGACPGWHYHLVDVVAQAAGYLAGTYGGDGYAESTWQHQAGHRWCFPPWDSEALSKAVGVNPADFDRHTAMGDARWAMAIYDAVMGDSAS